jgi:parvulin-like peptidyl-prolyl cis-trans isomerase-like protein
MRFVLLSTLTLLCAGRLFAQGPQAEAPRNNPAAMSKQQWGSQQALPEGKPSPTEAEVTPDTPVVTLEGICDEPRATGAKVCKTVITRAQMDSLIDMVSPGAVPAARSAFAIGYARLLAAADASQRQHLEKDPAVAAELQAQLKLARVRVLTKAFYHQLEEQATNVPDSEIQKFYTEHQANFEQGEVRRLTIPRSSVTNPGQPMDGQEVKAKMDQVEAMAARGEDFDQVQQEAYTMFGITAAPPPTKPILVRRASLRPNEATVFDLNVGEVTQVLSSPDAFVILKLESKEVVPIEVAQSEFKPFLQQQRKVEALQSAAKNVTAEFNLAYLGTATAPELFPPQAPSETVALKTPPPNLQPHPRVRRRMPFVPPGGAGLPPSR